MQAAEAVVVVADDGGFEVNDGTFKEIEQDDGIGVIEVADGVEKELDGAVTPIISLTHAAASSVKMSEYFRCVATSLSSEPTGLVDTQYELRTDVMWARSESSVPPPTEFRSQ